MVDDAEEGNRVQRGQPEHRWELGKYGGRGYPAGPLADETVGPPAAIGFCALCGANARATTNVRGFFDCPNCTHLWTDTRVGDQPRSFEDYFEPA